jgi:hypothetical protein
MLNGDAATGKREQQYEELLAAWQIILVGHGIEYAESDAGG